MGAHVLLSQQMKGFPCQHFEKKPRTNQTQAGLWACLWHLLGLFGSSHHWEKNPPILSTGKTHRMGWQREENNSQVVGP